MNYDKQIKRIMEEFDFDKVRKVMCALSWTWRDEENPPVEAQLRKSAKSLLQSVADLHEYGYSTGTGGFEARMDFNGDLHLRFVVEEWDGSDYTNGAEDDDASS